MAKLSVERIRAEIEKIIAGPHAEAMMAHVARLDLKEPLGIPEMGDSHLARAIRNGVTDPHDRIAAYLGYDAGAIDAIGAHWKLSGDARTRMMFVATHRQETDPTRPSDATNGCSPWIAALTITFGPWDGPRGRTRFCSV